MELEPTQPTSRSRVRDSRLQGFTTLRVYYQCNCAAIPIWYLPKVEDTIKTVQTSAIKTDPPPKPSPRTHSKDGTECSPIFQHLSGKGQVQNAEMQNYCSSWEGTGKLVLAEIKCCLLAGTGCCRQSQAALLGGSARRQQFQVEAVGGRTILVPHGRGWMTRCQM